MMAALIARDTLDALDYAHHAVGADGRPLGLVHRDVSPGNVLVSRRGDVKLTDFGIARAVERNHKTEAGMPPALLAQLDDAEAAARALGLVAWPMDAFEADDALASATARFRGEVAEVRILTPDKDLGQCLEAGRVVQVDRVRDAVIDEAALLARRGAAPASVPDLLALTGDEADGFPGLPGFGEKTVKMSIFNRWGEQLWVNEGMEPFWDGYYNGGIVQDGVYVYVLKYTGVCHNEEIETVGHVTVVR